MANKQLPLVSIVILNWNGLEDTKKCLKYVRALDYKNIEIIVVDNGSAPEQKEYLEKQKGIVYIDNPVNRGFTGGQIDGYNVARGEFVLLLNNDAVIKSNFLSEAIPMFDDPKVAVVGGRSYFWNDESPMFDETNTFYAHMVIDPISAETTILTEDAGVVQEANNVSGSAAVVRKSITDTIGYLYEPFFAYYEETDLFARMKRAGYKVLYNPKLQIWHKNGASSDSQGGSWFFYFHIFRNRFMFATRNFEPPYYKLFLRNYFKSWVKSLPGVLSGAPSRRLALAYTKAVFAALLRTPVLLRERRELAKIVGKTYVSKLINEQTKISFVIDASRATDKAISSEITRLLADKNPYHEYVFVVNGRSSVADPALPTVRIVKNKGYFNTHPINLGFLASRHDWGVVLDLDTKIDYAIVHQDIAQVFGASKSVIYNEGFLAIKRTYYQKMGGLQWDAQSLSGNFIPAAQYAKLDEELAATSLQLDVASPRIQDKLAFDNSLLAASGHGRWQRFLERHYRVLQVHSLAKWAVSPSIPIRLKLGRTKNIVLFAASLQRSKLATELRHTRNELRMYGKDGNAAALHALHMGDLAKITEQAKKHSKDIPVFVICFERVDSLKQLVAWLEGQGLKKIIFIDNDSSYKPLLDYYEKTSYQVLRLYRNIGHTAPWSLAITRSLVPEDYYIVTDPDVIPTESVPPRSIDHFIAIHAQFPAYLKVGFGLKIDDIPAHYPLRQSVIDWESQFWKTKMADGVYEAGVDTTFAVYKPYTYVYTLHPSLRLGEPYTARHLPWYNNPATVSDEERYYRLRANANVTSWNVDELPERYKKELGNGE